jgi:hypothetical protein
MFTSYFTELAIKTITIFDNLFKVNNDKNFIIDPLTCMIRLAMLSFKESGTKISIIDNKIAFNDPHILQGPLRWSQGDNRDDLHNLYRPIVKALEWYDMKEENIKIIFDLSINGIEKLKGAYIDNSSITHSLELYRKEILDLKNNVSKTTIDNNENVVINKIYMDLKQLWNKNEINIVTNLFNEIRNTSDINSIKSLMNALDSLIFIKEEKIKTIILAHTTLL